MGRLIQIAASTLLSGGILNHGSLGGYISNATRLALGMGLAELQDGQVHYFSRHHDLLKRAAIQVASQTAYGLLRSYPRYLKYWEQQVRDKYLQTQSQSSLANKTGQYYQLIREQQAVAQKKNHIYDTLRPLFSGQWDFDSLFRRMCRPTVEIAGRADASFETGRMFMPEYRMRPEERERYGDRRTMFLRLLDDGLDRKVPEPERERYRERLDEEVYIIESTDNVDYFLVQWDMVREAHRRGIATGIGRGSAGGSLVSYLLGITSIDPLKYDLIFSRFLVPERCGLSWKDELTVLAPDITLGKGERYVEMESEGKTYRLCTDARMRVIRNGEERTIYADELMCGDEILFDRRDCLWNLKELETHESDLRTPPSL